MSIIYVKINDQNKRLLQRQNRLRSLPTPWMEVLFSLKKEHSIEFKSTFISQDKGRPPAKKNVFFWALLELPPPPHFQPTCTYFSDVKNNILRVCTSFLDVKNDVLRV